MFPENTEWRTFIIFALLNTVLNALFIPRVCFFVSSLTNVDSLLRISLHDPR